MILCMIIYYWWHYLSTWYDDAAFFMTFSISDWLFSLILMMPMLIYCWLFMLIFAPYASLSDTFITMMPPFSFFRSLYFDDADITPWCHGTSHIDDAITLMMILFTLIFWWCWWYFSLIAAFFWCRHADYWWCYYYLLLLILLILIRWYFLIAFRFHWLFSRLLCCFLFIYYLMPRWLPLRWCWSAYCHDYADDYWWWHFAFAFIDAISIIVYWWHCITLLMIFFLSPPFSDD